MHLTYRNVNDAFRGILEGIESGDIRTVEETSRNGLVLRVPEPVIVTYERPRERVLFNTERDCNPFFHLYEAVWMLAGRNEVRSLSYFNRRMRDYSDNDETLRGAYGYRWKKKFGYDQLDDIVDLLGSHPDSRRAVLAMWNACICKDDDLSAALEGVRDIPCNTHVYFAIQEGALVMTVCNRSNDLIWGMLGANVVHMSILQEYLANLLGIPVGPYHQITNNLHVYLSNWHPRKWLSYYEGQQLPRYGASVFECPTKVVEDRKRFLRECNAIVDCFERPELRMLTAREAEEPFLRDTVQPMLRAFYWHRLRNYEEAKKSIAAARSSDWRTAGLAWILKRRERWEKKP